MFIALIIIISALLMIENRGKKYINGIEDYVPHHCDSERNVINFEEHWSAVSSPSTILSEI